MQFRVVIPDHAMVGQTIRIHCPDGTETNVKVPKGSKPGDSFIVELSADELKDAQGMLDAAKKESSSNATTTTINTAQAAVAEVTAARESSSFLDREIATWNDFVLAMTVGLIIGLGIVLGFLGGVLYVTRQVPLETGLSQSSHVPPGMQVPRISNDNVEVSKIVGADGKERTHIKITAKGSNEPQR